MYEVTIKVEDTGKNYNVWINGHLAYKGLSSAGLRDAFLQCCWAAEHQDS